jgi:glycosyltransferase involved in cell wall biosynthesis
VVAASGVKADILPFGVDTNRFAPAARIDAGHRVTIFLVVSYLVARKRVSDVIKAFAIVVSRRRDVLLRIVGDGPAREELMALVRSLHLEDVCEFYGRVPHELIAEEYRRADVVVSASASETFGMSLLEAMASGIPVISAVNDGSIGIIEDGETGFLVSVGDPNGMALKMEELRADRDLARRLGEAARQRVSELFSWDVIATQMQGAYASQHLRVARNGRD